MNRSIRFFESQEIIRLRYRDLHGRHPNAAKARSIALHVEQGANFIESATLAPISIRPLLQYYGVAALARAVTIFRSIDRVESTLTPGHGYSICNHGTLGGDHFSAGRPAHGSVSAEIIDPVEGIFWYAYGWPCGEAAEAGDQLLQECSWGAFIGFPLATLPPGTYTTLQGELTPLAAVHFADLIPEERASQDGMSPVNWRRSVVAQKGPMLRA